MKLSNRIITIDRTPVYFGTDALSSADKFVGRLYTIRKHPVGAASEKRSQNQSQKIFILVDQITRRLCLPLLLEKTISFQTAQIIEIEGGEDSKTLATAEKIWSQLLDSGADRTSLLVNLGGGVVSDLGGFAAAGYKRGIRYINIPTTLIGQADAAIGGKTGVNLGHIKNQIGFFHAPQGIFIYPGFLDTLPEEHLRSGLAEIIKSALVGDKVLWYRLLKHPVEELLNKPVDGMLWNRLIASTIKFKNRVVMGDYREHKLRKVLNFGHTIGHGLESYSMTEPGKHILHGDAVAAGMICATFLSFRKTGLPQADFKAIKNYLLNGFPSIRPDASSIPDILGLMKHDKKVSQGNLQFTLISKPGSPVINITCNEMEIREALTILSDSPDLSG